MMLPNLNMLAEQTPNLNFMPFGNMSYAGSGMNGFNSQGSTQGTIPQYVNNLFPNPCIDIETSKNQQKLLEMY